MSADLQLYTHPLSPCAQKVRIVLSEKQLPWISHHVSLPDKENLKPDYLALNPPWLNLFENRSAIQFNHRVLAIVTVLLVVSFSVRAQVAVLPKRVKVACTVFMLAALLQAGLGIATLLTFVPISLAAIHQAGAMVLLTAGIWSLYALRPRVYVDAKSELVDSMPPPWRPPQPAA